MSYSVDLWNSYNKLEQILESHLKGLKTFIYIFSEYYSCQQTFSKELKRLSDYLKNNSITTFESLNEGIISFQNDLLNQHDYLKENLNNIKEEIISPLKELKERITKRKNNNLNEMLTNEKLYNNCLAQFENAKLKFHKSVKEVEQNKLEVEIIRKEKYPQDKITEQEIKALNSLKTAKENEKNYIFLINNINNKQEEYIEIKKKNLNELKNMEEDIGLYIKDSLRKYIVYQVSYIRNFQYDIDKKAKIMENINIIKDLNEFIYKNTTKDIPPFKHDYIPYLSEINKNKMNSKIDKNVLDNINNFIENNFASDKAKEMILLKNKNNLELEAISEEIFVSKINIENFDKTKMEKIKNYVKNKKDRREILKNMNNLRRIKGLNINNISYENIGKIFNLCLNDIIQNSIEDIDYISIIIILSLSSTLYKVSENSNEKIFLNKYIKSHKIWKRYDIWKGVIKYNINEEMHNQKNFNRYYEENLENKNKRIINIVKFQISSYLNIMTNLDIKNNIINDIISEFKYYYDLDQDVIQEFNKIIENNIKDNNNNFELKNKIDNII